MCVSLIYVVWRRNVLLNSTGALVPEEWAAFLNENAQKVASLEKEVEAQVKFSERSKENLKAFHHHNQHLKLFHFFQLILQ